MQNGGAKIGHRHSRIWPYGGAKLAKTCKPLKTLENKVYTGKAALKTRQAIEIIELNGATGGSSPSCGSCMTFLGSTPATQTAAPSISSQTDAMEANAVGRRHKKTNVVGRLSALFASTLRGAALCSGLLLSGTASAEGWTQLGGDQWRTTERISMRSGDRETPPVSANGWVSLNRFDERSRPSVAKPSIGA